jgi:serine/threonine protein kinase
LSSITKYRLDHELGRGGMAVVYAAYDENLERPVALKVLAAHLAGQPEFRARFLREARIAARLTHPNLVRTIDVAEHDGLPCIVMELLPGRTLVDGSLTRAEAADLAAGLAYAHRSGVVHRDLKPANILRASDGTPKIADFGIASAVGETILTEVGTVLGTLRYLSPEQAAGEQAGAPADVYSFAVLLDELLVNRSSADRLLLERCRQTDPAHRPAAAELAAAFAGGPLGADPSTAPTRLLPTSVLPTRVPTSATRRRTRRAALLAAILIVAIVAIVAIVGTDRGHRSRVDPVPHSPALGQQARNLSVWLARYSR